MNVSRRGLMIALAGLTASQFACSRQDDEQAKRKLRETGRELKQEAREDSQKAKQAAKKAGRELNHEAHEAASEIKKDAHKAKQNLDSK